MNTDELRGAMAVISAINDIQDSRENRAVLPVTIRKYFAWLAALTPEQVNVSFDIYLLGQDMDKLKTVAFK